MAFFLTLPFFISFSSSWAGVTRRRQRFCAHSDGTESLTLPPSVSGVSECRCDGSNPSWKGFGRRTGRDLTHKIPSSLGTRFNTESRSLSAWPDPSPCVGAFAARVSSGVAQWLARLPFSWNMWWKVCFLMYKIWKPLLDAEILENSSRIHVKKLCQHNQIFEWLNSLTDA